MFTALFSLSTVVLLAAPSLQTSFVQVGPADREAAHIERSADEDRAVVLIQGLCMHPFSSKRVAQACWQGWQKSDSDLVQALAKNADVFAFSYSQNVAVDDIASSDDLPMQIRRLKDLGYKQIVLVGHSAGGIIARQFVEDHPDAGVTKVVQVCTPNRGSSWGRFESGVRKSQEVFVTSLTPKACQKRLQARRDKKIPNHVEFVCLVGQLEFQVDAAASFEVGEGSVIEVSAKKEFRGDGIVSSKSQWPDDLQEQFVPAVAVAAYHFEVTRNPAAIEKIAQLAREKQPRLMAAELEIMRQEILGPQ